MLVQSAVRQKEFRALLWRSVVVPVGALTAAALLLSWAVGRLLGDAAEVQHADEAIARATSVLKLAVDMETGLRGYQLTGQREMLAPYEQAAAQIAAAFQQLRESTHLNPAERTLLDEVDAARREWLGFAEDVIRRRAAGEPVASYELNVRGKELFDTLRAAFAKFIASQEQEKDRLATRLAQLDRRVLQFRFGVLLTLGLGIGWFVYAQISRVAQMFRDAEKDAWARAETLRVTLRSIGEGVIAADAAGRITFLNPAAARLSGWSEAEAVGKPLGEVYRLVDEATRQPIPEPAVAAQHPESGERPIRAVALVTRDGREVAISDNAAPIRADDQTVTGTIVVFHDITREQAAAAERAQLAAIVENAAAGIVAKRVDGTIYEWNAGAEKLFGYTAAEMIGRSILTLVPPNRLEEEAGILARTRAGVPTIGLHTVRRRKDGTLVNVSITVSPIRDASGKVIGGAKIAQDISELTRTLVELRSTRQSLLEARANLERKVEARTHELSNALQKAQEVDRLKSEFLATMSHELRTPLNSVIGFTELVMAEIPGPLNEEQKRQLGMAHTSARHLLHLINDLLDLARIESGRVEPVWERFSPAEPVREAIESLQPLANRKGIRLVAELSLPDEIHSDRKMFFQILLNLLANAVKFTQQGQVTLTSRVEEQKLIMRVADTGIGIKPEQMGLLFEAFRQIDGTSRRRYEGTGLGLYLCRRLVTMLGGEINAESQFGVGSVFTFSVPLNPPPRS